MRAAVGRFKSLAQHIERYATAIMLKSESADFHRHLGRLHRERGRLPQALAHYQKAVCLDPASTDTCIALSQILRQIFRRSYDPKLEQALEACFASPAVEYQMLAEAAGRQVRLKHGLTRQTPKAWEEVLGKDGAGLDDEAILSVLGDPFLAALLVKTTNVDPELELFLTGVRRALLFARREADDLPESMVRFMALIARQTYTNGYAFWQGEDERREIERLQSYIEAALEAEAPSWDGLLVRLCRLAMYAPLSRLAAGERLLERPLDAWPDFLQPVLEDALVFPIEEAAIRADIVSIGEIMDSTSREVRAQYEESPYPCWKWVKRGQPIDIWTELREQFSGTIRHPFPDGPVEMLVAGCGTGRQPITCAISDPNLKVLAMDLSKSSLAYAIRMARRLDVNHVEFLHGDILDLPSLGRGFPVIECIGVLHHMEDPLAGWRILTDLLHPGGMMKIGLYSETARRSLVPVRDKITDLGLQPRPDDMRELRRLMLLGDGGEDLTRPLDFRDFYHLNEPRDLVFHVMEHRFTIPQLADNLETLGLEFVGFDFKKDVISRRYAGHNPQDPDMTDLSSWAAFEERNPDTFIGMYQFWCQKPAVR